MTLRLVLENTPTGDISPMPSHPSGDFVEAALRTARNSKAETRDAILADVCEVLDCRLEDLKFLFSQKSVPNRNRPIFGLELPDYRMSLSDVYKEAAE